MADEILIRFSVKDDGSPVIEKVNQKLGETTKQSKALVPGLESARESLTGFVGQNAGLIAVLVGVGAALKDVIDTGIKYAMTVDEMARAGGQSTEEASRFLQVLDDYEISAQDALAATRALTQKGLAPNIETLASLSDRYLALNTVEEKNAFIIDNLGRGGLQWAKALEQGREKLLAQAAAVDKSLVLTKEQVKAADDARLALDNLSDSVEGLKMSLSMDLLPWLTKVIEFQNKYSKAAQENKYFTDYLIPGVSILRNTFIALTTETDSATDAVKKNRDANEDLKKSAEAAAEAEKKQAEAARMISDAISNRIGLINQIQSADEAYAEKSKDLNKERQDTEAELAKFRAQGYSEFSEQVQGSLTKLDEIKQKEADLAAERDKQTLQFISNILAEQLARDGWTKEEFDAFAKQQEAWGLWSAGAVAKAQAAWKEADHVAQSIGAIPENKTINIDIRHNDIYTTEGIAGRSGASSPHAGGGSFMIPYGGGNESFLMPGGNTASPGETVTIDKAGGATRTDELLERLLDKKMIDEGRLARVLASVIVQNMGGG